MPPGNELPESTASEESLSWAKEHLRRCTESHQSCKAVPNSPLPARVLDIRYCRRVLTNQGDIFPAISGLAKNFQKARNSTYVAGLWLDDLPRSLLWYDNYSLPGLSSCRNCAPTEYRIWKNGPADPWRAPS